MIALAICWVVFPLVLGVIAIGCGQAVEWLAGARIPAALLLPVGIAAIIVVVSAMLAFQRTVALAAPVVIGLAVVGFGLSPNRIRELDPRAAAAGLTVFAMYAAPVVLSGQATFAGYITLDDTATWLALTDHVMEHGRSLSGLAPSTYEAILAALLPTGYPIGFVLPLGIGHEIVQQDSAWLFQPYLAFLAGALALCLWSLLSPLIRSSALRTVCVVIAAQPAILYAYALWSGIKELVAAVLLALAAALLVAGRGAGARALIPLAVTVAAMVLAVSAGGLIYVGPVLAVGLVLVLRSRAPRALVGLGVLTAVALVAASVALSREDSFVRRAVAQLRGNEDIGNLLEPLDPLQLLGIWPTGDFRVAPGDLTVTRVLLLALAAAAAFGLFVAVRGRSWGVLAYLSGALGGVATIYIVGSPWLEAKALATASPAVVLLAVIGCAGLVEGGRRAEGFVLLVAISGGVLWSNGLAYHSVNLAPRAQLRELERIGDDFDAQGPSLMTEFQPYGVRHFLRRLDPEGASELRRRPVPLVDGSVLEKDEFADIDYLRPDGLLIYRTLVLRRSPAASRPPSIYRRVWRGRYYEVWQRPQQSVTLLRLPLGEGFDATAPADCSQVLRLAREASRTKTSLVAASRPAVTVVNVGNATHPPTWGTNQANPSFVVPSGSGKVTASVQVPAARYDLWLGGSFRRRLRTMVDGRTVGTEAPQLNNTGQYNPLGSIALGAGTHTLELDYGGESVLAPGRGGAGWPFGPLTLAPDGRERTRLVDPARARTLCGKRLDWVEVVVRS